MRDIVIIGGGHNGLVAAAYLARAGFKPLVLERLEVAGGAAVTGEIARGYRGPTLAHAAGPLRPDIVRDLELARHGLELLRSEVRVMAPAPDGRALVLYEDEGRSVAEIARFSERDARAYPGFHASLARIGAFLAPLLSMTPPAIDRPSRQDLWALLQAGRRFRGLGREDAHRLLRWGPMAVADLAGEWFESEPLRASVAARGLTGSFAGPWSAGTSAVLLLQAAADPGGTGGLYVRGGPGALTHALSVAATQAGAEVRTGAEVRRILVKDGAAAGVVLESGEEIAARTVVSNADPRRTFLGLIDPVELGPEFLLKIRNYRSVGTVAKVNLALSGLPDFPALAARGDGRAALSGRIHIGPEIDYLEQAFDAAKYGECSARPYLDVTIPTLLDPSLAPPGGHVVSICAQFAPYALRRDSWDARRGPFGDLVVRTLAEYAPGLEALIVGRHVISPLDLEETWGLTGGHIHHGEPSLDQLFTMRPLLGWARYRTPLRGLYLCGAGTHPGGGVTGAPGANASREILRDLGRP